MRRLIYKRREQGFVLEGLAIALVILTLLSITYLTQAREESLDQIAVNQGSALSIVRNVANSYLTDNYELIMNAAPGAPIQVPVGTGFVTVAHNDAPTIAELVQLGKTPPNFNGNSFVGGNYAVLIQKVPLNVCTPPACDLEGLAYIDKPFTINGIVDYVRLGLAVGKIGPDGAGSRLNNGATLSGFGGKWSTSNPVAGAPGGILAMRFGYSSSDFAAFYRRSGIWPLTGDMPANGNSINGVNNLTATGVVKGSEFSTPIHQVTDACINDGALGSGPVVNGNTVVMVCAGGKWQEAGLKADATSACTVPGKLASDTVTSEGLMCKNGFWIRLKNVVAQIVPIQEVNFKDGDRVPKVGCEPGGSSSALVVLNSIVVDDTNLPPKQTFTGTYVDGGADWVMQIFTADDQGGTTSGNAYGAKGRVILECKY